MKNQSARQILTALAVGIGIFSSLNLALFAPAADAACRPNGRRVAGRAVLTCTGRTSCRPTGRYKTVRGVRYQILRCPNN
jgi:hypothetical protein